MKNFEAKFYNTSLKFNEALLTLLQDKYMEDISISEICQKAELNRTTFYAHYKNTYDLLKEIIDRFTQKLYSSFTFGISIMDEIDSLDKLDLLFVSEKFLLPFLTFAFP